MTESAWSTLSGKPTRVIAHRGASGYLPEHTVAAYELALAQGADAIEPDVVVSRDGVLVARHDRGLARSTDVGSHPEFAGRARTLANGSRDWFVDDFDWAELQTLFARQPFPGRSLEHEGRYRIPRLEQLLDLAAAAAGGGSELVVCPELKHPAAFAATGNNLIERFITLLDARSLRGQSAPVWVHCFEHEPLERIRAALDLPVFALFEPEDAHLLGSGPYAWEAVARRCRGIALNTRSILGDEGARRVQAAHGAGLAVNVWTFRDDAVPDSWHGVYAEYEHAFALGVDAVFSDFPDTALAARAQFAAPVNAAG
jgi:glycerophosphoryl diester phosphodiesterase